MKLQCLPLGFALALTATAVFAQSGADGGTTDGLDFLLNTEPVQADAEPAAADEARAEADRQEPQQTAGPEVYPDAIAVSEPQAAAPAQKAARSRLVEEIVVTAQKREENLQDVPISVNAFSGDMLDARGIADPKDLPLATPGLTLGSQAGFTVTYLRGVGSDAFLMADPSVALYIDNIYFPFAHGLAQNFGALERVEVLKGPQGTLFGRNAVGGAINVVTKAPSFEAPETSIQLSYADEYSDLQTRVHTNVPLTDTFAISFSGIYNKADPVMDGTADGKPLPEEISRGARIKLRWAPFDALDLNLAGFRLEQQGVSTMFAVNSDPSLISLAAGIRPNTGYEGDVDAPVYFNLDNTVFYGQANFYADWFDVKLIGSDQYVETNSLYDFDGSALPLVQFEAKKQYADAQTAELQILSNDSSWGSDWLTWIAGGYYFKSRQGFDPNILSVAGLDLREGRLLGIDLPDGLFDALSRLLSLLPIGLDGVPSGGIKVLGVIDTESTAGFAQATADLTDWMALTLGGRYQVEERRIHQSRSYVDGTNVAINPDSAGLSDTTSSFKPKVSLDFRPWDGTLLYMSWQEAIKSATYNVINIYDRADYVEPEEMEAYEIGIKTDFFDGLMRFSAAAFQYDLTNLQVQFISLLQGGAVTFENAGGARIRGIDFDTTVELFPSLVQNLVLTAGGAWLDGKYTDYRNASGFQEPTGILTTNNDFTGNDITRTPEFSGTFGLSKTFLMSGGPLELAADVYYNSGFYYLAQNTDFNYEDEYTIVGARISYLYERWGLRMTLFGRNVTDEDYNYSRFTNDFGALNAKAPRSSYGVRMNWDF